MGGSLQPRAPCSAAAAITAADAAAAAAAVHLVIAAAAGVKLPPNSADELSKASLIGGMDVLVARLDNKLSGCPLRRDLIAVVAAAATWTL